MTQSRPHLLGIDIGTTGAKAVLIDATGNVAATATSQYPVSTPKPLWSEQDPEHWWKGAVKSIRAVLEQSGVAPMDVAGIGLSGQMHGLVLLDKSQRVLRPAILWNDQRTSAQCEQVTAKFGLPALLELTGNPVLPGFTLPKIMWVSENEPEVYSRIAHFLLPKDYVRLRLTGELATEVSDASGTSLFDIKKRAWSEPIFDEMGIPKHWAPQCFESPLVSGNISVDGAKATGLPQGVPVVGGGGDQAAQAIGAGLAKQGRVSVTLGTSGVVFAPTDRPRIDEKGRLHSFCHAVPGMWHVMGVMLSAGGSLAWYRDTFADAEKKQAQECGTDVYELLMDQAKTAPVGSDGLLFLPYLSGERTPYPDPHARGAFVGLTVRHQRPQMVRAIIEGVSFGLRDSLELIRRLDIPTEKVYASGGGARSALWREILANVFDAQVVTVNLSQGAALGACLLAGVGAGIFSDVESACELVVQQQSSIEPQSVEVAKYGELFSLYQRLYPALRSVNNALGKFDS
jgi:xylulokinase